MTSNPTVKNVTENLTASPVMKPGSNENIIVGAAAAGGALLVGLLVAGMYYKSKSISSPSLSPGSFPQHEAPASDNPPLPPEPNRVHQPVMAGTGNTAPPLTTPTLRPATRSMTPLETVTTNASREGEDDVSTLEYPYVDSGIVDKSSHLHPSEDTVGGSEVSSGHKGYVWAVGRERTYTGDGPSTVTGGTPKFADDSTIEGLYREQRALNDGSYERASPSNFQQLTVVAPKGKIGLSLDNPTGDVPIIHGVKETSILYGKVKVGDLLISLDEIDCRGKSAMRVTKLINSRRQNPARALVLLRRVREGDGDAREE